MDLDQLSPTTIAGIKRLAGRLGSATGLTRQQALDAAARQAGHVSYHGARKALAEPAAAASRMTAPASALPRPPSLTGRIFEPMMDDREMHARAAELRDRVPHRLVVSLAFDDLDGSPRVVSADMALRRSPLAIVPQGCAGGAPQFEGWRHRAADRLVAAMPEPVTPEVARRVVLGVLRPIQFADITGFVPARAHRFASAPLCRRSCAWERWSVKDRPWSLFAWTDELSPSDVEGKVREVAIWPGKEATVLRRLPWSLAAAPDFATDLVVQADQAPHADEIVALLEAVEPVSIEGPIWREDDRFDAITTEGERLQHAAIAAALDAARLERRPAMPPADATQGRLGRGLAFSSLYRPPIPPTRLRGVFHERVAELAKYVEEVSLHAPGAQEHALALKAELSSWAQHEKGHAAGYGVARKAGPDVHSHLEPDGRLPAALRDLAVLAVDEVAEILRVGYPPCDPVSRLLVRLSRLRAALTASAIQAASPFS